MKKIYLMLLILIVPCILCSCGSASSLWGENSIRVNGIEEYPSNLSNFELHVHLLPSDDFIQQFEYLDAEYHFAQDYKGAWDISGVERVILAITYQDSIYGQAKEYCMEEMQLSQENVINYNEYTFLENIELAIGQDRYGADKLNGYPQWFQMFAYNDAAQCLIFMGFYDSEYTSQDAKIISSEWDSFLEKHFFELYDFKTESSRTVDCSVS